MPPSVTEQESNMSLNDTPQRETRFRFGRNWSYFLNHIDEPTIQRAEESLRVALETDDLQGRSFLDLGSGSGLFSLAARRLGAQVRSIDIDSESVQCTRELKRRFATEDSDWQIEHGSALDLDFLKRQAAVDVVYSWGVLHHTGQMWQAVENTIALVKPGGRYYIAIYNDQGGASRRWTRVKYLYNRLPSPLRPIILSFALARIWGPTTLRDTLRLKPFHTWRTYHSARGMNAWRDFIDWVGGYPFEVAKPEEVLQFCRQRGMELMHLKTCGSGRGCNEFVFAKEVKQ